MSREIKIVLGIFGGLALLFVIGVTALVVAIPHFAKSLDAAPDPASARRVAEKIATFTLPADYAIVRATDFGVTQMVTIEKPGSHAFQMQLRGALVPSGGDSAVRGMKIGLSLIDRFAKCDQRDAGTDDVTVRGVVVKLSVLECANPQFPMRIETGTFPGNAPEATITAFGLSGGRFDERALHALLESVR